MRACFWGRLNQALQLPLSVRRQTSEQHPWKQANHE